MVLALLGPGVGLNEANNTILNFVEILVPSRTIFIFIRQNHTVAEHSLTNWNHELPIFPALKIILEIPPNFQHKLKQNQVCVRPICLGYCLPSTVPVANFDTSLKVNTLETIHHSLFWKAHQKRIVGLVWDAYQWTLRTPKNKQNVCLSPLNMIDLLCKSDIMSLLAFQQTHNMSIEFYQTSFQTLATMRAGETFKGNEIINVPSSRGLTKWSLLHVSIGRLSFFELDSLRLVYCRKINTGSGLFSGFVAWYQPFTSRIWIAILIVFCYGIVFALKQRGISGMLDYVSGIFGQGFPLSIQNFVTLCGMGYLCTVYANELTSIVTVASTPVPFKTLQQFLDNGYKIIFRPSYAESVKRIRDEDFKFLGVYENSSLGTTFVAVNKTNIPESISKYLQPGKKLADMQYTTVSKNFQARAVRVLRKKEPSSFCFTLDQRLQQNHFYWVMKTENQNWLKVSALRLHASGLKDKWEEWAGWHYMLATKTLDQRYVPQGDVIGIKKFFCIGLLACLFMGISCVVFGIEKFQYFAISSVNSEKRLCPAETITVQTQGRVNAAATADELPAYRPLRRF
ncbi:unnamed protein product [Orchesella dallaii]|uniref:Ionotropic glutamate receptor C-terminal domain-containing protein n=1 Tax=Orchesella dallaii TaxID=48710 RepID=A0ABP1RGX9_9HEXA